MSNTTFFDKTKIDAAIKTYEKEKRELRQRIEVIDFVLGELEKTTKGHSDDTES